MAQLAQILVDEGHVSDVALAAHSPLAATVSLNIFRCPITHDVLREMTVAELDAFNFRVANRTLLHIDGSPVAQPLQAALCCRQHPIAYQIVDGIMVLLPSLAIALDESQSECDLWSLNANKLAVRGFYESSGWQQNEAGDFADAEIWEDLRPVSQDYIRKCHQRVKRHLPPRGRYLLDVASGPVQYADYLTYSEDYSARLCVDISMSALRAARRRLGEHGIYVLGDITNLPLRDNSIDGCVSLHTIYHVPAEEQAQAFRELYRVIKPGAAAVAVYCWRSRLLKALGTPAKLAALPGKLWHRHSKRLAPALPSTSGCSTPKSSGEFYYHAFSHSWFVRQEFPFALEILPWRSIDVPLMRAYIHKYVFGRAALSALYWLEEKLPRVFGRFGSYPLIVIRKS